MPTLKPRLTVVLEPSRAALLRAFAAEHDLTLSELIAAIVEPFAAEVAWVMEHEEHEQPSLFPPALIELYREHPYEDDNDVYGHLHAALEAIRAHRHQASSMGFLGAVGVSEDAGATAPPDAANDRKSLLPDALLTPGSNTGVTLSRHKRNQRVSKPRQGAEK